MTLKVVSYKGQTGNWLVVGRPDCQLCNAHSSVNKEVVFVAEIKLRNTEDSERSFHHQCCCLLLGIQSLAGDVGKAKVTPSSCATEVVVREAWPQSC